MPNRESPVVRLRGVTKSFVGTVAVSNVDLDILPGEVHAVVGENGAGKSTLMKVLAGFYPDYEGDIFIEGTLQKLSSPRQAMSLGIALVHQELSLVPELTVAENIFLNREPGWRIPGVINRKRTVELAAQVLREVGAKIAPTERIARLSVAKQQLVEIAKGVSRRSKVLILDEPTSSLTAPEINDLFRIIHTLKARGTAVVYISHRLAEVFAIADRITVLRDGVKVESAPVSEWDEPRLVKAMVGRDLYSFFSRSHHYAQKDLALEVCALSRPPHFEDVNFKVYKGEVLGIYGLVGAGRTELAEAICGLASSHAGRILVNGTPTRIKSPRDAIASGIALVPEDRRTLGLIATMDLRKNLSLPVLGRLSALGFVRQRRETEMVEDSIRCLAIRAPAVSALVSTLSGGNQQKVVVGKWLNANPKILILDEPTKGIDVGAKAEIREIIDRLAGEGKAVILVSSELPEILGMSDRVLVMRQGHIVGEFARDEASDEILGACAAGLAANHAGRLPYGEREQTVNGG